MDVKLDFGAPKYQNITEPIYKRTYDDMTSREVSDLLSTY